MQIDYGSNSALYPADFVRESILPESDPIGPHAQLGSNASSPDPDWVAKTQPRSVALHPPLRRPLHPQCAVAQLEHCNSIFLRNPFPKRKCANDPESGPRSANHHSFASGENLPKNAGSTWVTHSRQLQTLDHGHVRTAPPNRPRARALCEHSNLEVVPALHSSNMEHPRVSINPNALD